ncbi:MAG: DUF4293 domain-containing protein [Lewinellaceae bacterium]|nr:DUF4293 domain-containing protein [Saprospiraceae bacterium]MCB9331332.1 DUF4293 domain-containing protein [Lewinellaceae bacterium]
MIQRIQSIFLLLAAGALGGQFAFPYLQTPADDPARSLASLSDGVLNPLDNPGLLGLTGLGVLISLAAIFLFKNRSLQMRLALVGAGIGIMLLVLLGITVKNTLGEVPENGTINITFGMSFPILALLFNWLAARAIRKDEALVRSMDRLR